MEQDHLEGALRSVLVTLRPYWSDMVLIGGWVPYLYRHYGGFQAWGGSDALTFELDVLVPQPLAAEGRAAIAQLLRQAGFQPHEEYGPAAVWIGDASRGEKIEFIAPHRGTARGLGRSVPLQEQPGVGAIPLTKLEVLAEHTRTLQLPPLRGMPAVEVRVPTLGAYALNKALTFISRGARLDEGGTPKMAKDLLYLADLMAAGGDVVNAIEQDIHMIAQGSIGNAEQVGSAATNVRFVIEGHLRDKIAEPARMMMERSSASNLGAEEARMEGHLRDFQEILAECANLYAPVEADLLDEEPD